MKLGKHKKEIGENLDNMNNIPTAEEILINNIHQDIQKGGYSYGDVHPVWINRAMREFAKLHVEAALKTASENVNLKESSSEEINTNNISPFITADDNTIWIINKDSILNAYPLENIK